MCAKILRRPRWHAGPILFFLLVAAAMAAESGRIDGKVVGSDQLPNAGGDVRLMRGESLLDSAISDEQGRFRFEKVAPGSYEIHFQLGDGTTVEPAVQVRAGET